MSSDYRWKLLEERGQMEGIEKGWMGEGKMVVLGISIEADMPTLTNLP